MVRFVFAFFLANGVATWATISFCLFHSQWISRRDFFQVPQPLLLNETLKVCYAIDVSYGWPYVRKSAFCQPTNRYNYRKAFQIEITPERKVRFVIVPTCIVILLRLPSWWSPSPFFLYCDGRINEKSEIAENMLKFAPIYFLTTKSQKIDLYENTRLWTRKLINFLYLRWVDQWWAEKNATTARRTKDRNHNIPIQLEWYCFFVIWNPARWMRKITVMRFIKDTW
jgi:hypothetical protein